MKKKINFIIVITAITIIVSAFVPTNVLLAATEATPTSTVIDKLKQIEILKEKIATKVAEIRASEKAGVAGTVKSVSKSKLIIKTKTGDINVDYLDDTIFYNLSQSEKVETSASKIKEGAQIAAFGYSDNNKTSLSAKYIYLTTPTTVHLIGKIADVDKANFTITVKEPQGNTSVDIETYSKMSQITADNKLAKIGFSKLKIGDTAHIAGTPNPKEENRLSANRIITLSANTPTITEKSEEESSPSADQ